MQNIDYINIPILGKYYFTDALSVDAGPQMGFLASAQLETEVEGADGGQAEGDADVSDVTNGTDFGIVAGLKYRLDMGVFFSGRYNLGVSNINDFTGSDNFKQQNNVIQLSVGYSF
jgi:hypothetical protein